MRRLAGVLTMVGCLAVPGVARAETPAENGATVYGAQKCGMCHSVSGKGNPKGVLDGVGKKLKADEIREWIVNAPAMTAQAKATRKPAMKAYSQLSKGDVEALVAYLQSLK